MKAVFELMVRIELSDAELEKRLVNLLEDAETEEDIDWSSFKYLCQFSDETSISYKHRRKKDVEKKVKRRSRWTDSRSVLGS